MKARSYVKHDTTSSRVLAFLTVQAEVLSVAAEVEVSDRGAEVVHHTPHVLVGEDAPGGVELH